jgi:hypothetical protein
MNADSAHAVVARYLVQPAERNRLLDAACIDPVTASALDRFAAFIARVRHVQLIDCFPRTFEHTQKIGKREDLFLALEPRFQLSRLSRPRDKSSQLFTFRNAVEEFARRGASPENTTLVDLANHEYALALLAAGGSSVHSPAAGGVQDVVWRARFVVVTLTSAFADSIGVPEPDPRDSAPRRNVLYSTIDKRRICIRGVSEDAAFMLDLLAKTGSCENLLESLGTLSDEMLGQTRASLQCFVSAGLFDWIPPSEPSGLKCPP